MSFDMGLLYSLLNLLRKPDQPRVPTANSQICARNLSP